MMARAAMGLAAAASLAIGLAAGPAAALDRRVQINNVTGYTIVAFYGSNTGTDDWQEDILGVDVLPSGNGVMVNFDDASGYCMFDFRADFEDGDSVVERGVNVCETGTFTFR